MRVNNISGFVQMYSTVGDLVPICLRKMLLNTWATSFLPWNIEIKYDWMENVQWKEGEGKNRVPLIIRVYYLEINTTEILDEKEQKIAVVELLRKLSYDDVSLRLRFSGTVQHVLNVYKVLAHIFLGLKL